MLQILTDLPQDFLKKDRGSQTGEKLQPRLCLNCSIVAENGLGLCDTVSNYFNFLLDIREILPFFLLEDSRTRKHYLLKLVLALAFDTG